MFSLCGRMMLTKRPTPRTEKKRHLIHSFLGIPYTTPSRTGPWTERHLIHPPLATTKSHVIPSFMRFLASLFYWTKKIEASLLHLCLLDHGIHLFFVHLAACFDDVRIWLIEPEQSFFHQGRMVLYVLGSGTIWFFFSSDDPWQLPC